MTKETAVKLFGSRKVRTLWVEENQKWYFAIVDVVGILTESIDPAAYWRKLKERLKAEGNETVTNCHALKMPASDGKMRLTDVADDQQLLRLIQSVPSPKAEPFKQWLAQVGSERLDENDNPELSIERAILNYQKLGYSQKWILERLKSIEVRKELTEEWEKRGMKRGLQFALLTDEILKGWSGFSTVEYKKLKDLKTENLRDHMTNLELVLNMLAEATTAEISRQKKPKSYTENEQVAREGGTIAGNTRKAIEAKTGKKIVSALNAKKLSATNPKKKMK